MVERSPDMSDAFGCSRIHESAIKTSLLVVMNLIRNILLMPSKALRDTWDLKSKVGLKQNEALFPPKSKAVKQDMNQKDKSDTIKDLFFSFIESQSFALEPLQDQERSCLPTECL